MPARMMHLGWFGLSMLAVLVATARPDELSGLIDLWQLNEANGTRIAMDSIGTDNAALLNSGAAFSTDPTRGQVLSVNGTPGSVALAPTNPINVNSGTILGWVELTPGSDTGKIAMPFPGQAINGGNRIYIYSTNGHLTIGMGNSSQSGTTSAPTFDGNWHQVALTWSGTGGNGSFTAYFDGVPVETHSYSGLTTPAQWLSIGANYDPTDTSPGTSSSWVGKISDVGVWNRPLTSQEVSTIYHRGAIVSIAPPAPTPPAVFNTYTFNSLHAGTIAGQDFWTTPPGGSLTVEPGTGVNHTTVVGDGAANGIAMRVNNAISGFQQFTGTETAAISQFDLTLTSGSGTGAGEIFGLGHDQTGDYSLTQANEFGPMFGIRDGYASYDQFGNGQRQFGFYLQNAGQGEIQGSPLGNYGTYGDWMQVRLVENFVTGTGSLYFRNLTRGQTQFTPVPGLQNVNLHLSAGPAPSTWDTMILNNHHMGMFDNLVPNLAGSPNVPEPGTASLSLAAVAGFYVFLRRRNGRAARVILLPIAGKDVRTCPVLSIIALAVLLCAATADGQTLSRGQAILQQRGLQIMAVISPQEPDPSAGIPPFDKTLFNQSQFTSMMIVPSDRSWDLSRYLGPAPGIPSSIQLSYGYLNSVETPYAPNLVALQLNDEQDMSNPIEVQAAQNVFADWRNLYPNTLGYANQSGPENTYTQLVAYVKQAQPDMVMFDSYEFNGALAGGSPTYLYRDLQKYRAVGLAGTDGTGQHPIPYGLYLQTSIVPVLNNHIPSASEMRLNEFSAWAFGYTYAAAYTYYNGNTTLFTNAPYDQTPRQPTFNDLAETNRESRNIGPALVHLHSTDLSMIMGQHKQGSSTISNTLPPGVPSWTAGAGNDQYLTGITATNLGADNAGLPGDVIIGHFQPMLGASDLYFMIVNGLTNPTGTVAEVAQRIHLTFNFGNSGINSLERLSRDTGQVEIVPLIHDSGSLYHLDLTLDGGTGDLFKYNNNLPFVGLGIPGDLNSDGVVNLTDFAILQTQFLQNVTPGSGGDINGDGIVDVADFALFRQDYQSANGIEISLPEPGTLVLVLIGVANCLAVPVRRMAVSVARRLGRISLSR